MARTRNRIDPTLDCDIAKPLDQVDLDRRPALDSRPPRPFGVSCIGVVMFIAGMLGVAAIPLAFVFDFPFIESFSPFHWVVGVQFLLATSACLFGSFYLWEGFKLGWTLAVFLVLLEFFLALQGASYMLLLAPENSPDAFGTPSYLRVGIKFFANAALIVYLFSGPVRAYFKLQAREASARAGFGLALIAVLWLWSSYIGVSAS